MNTPATFAAVLAAALALHTAALAQPTSSDPTANPGATPGATPTRDAAVWPFATRDPFNIPIGDGARYEPIRSPGFDPDGGAVLRSTSWSQPVYIARPDDQVRNIFQNDEPRPVVRIRVPRNAMPDPEGDAHLHLLDESHLFAVEMYRAVRLPNGDFRAEAAVRTELRGSSVPRKPIAIRAYGGSGLAGLIRGGEPTHGIRHVLALAVRREALNRSAPGSGGHRPYVWPAVSADELWDKPVSEGGYGSSGNLHLGTLLAIPPDVDLARLGIGESGPAYEIARALRDYGGYIVDPTSRNLALFAEPTVATGGELPDDLDTALALIAKHLKVVTNNTPKTPGGGGKPRREYAPEFPRLELSNRP